jgi:hypothetical protein
MEPVSITIRVTLTAPENAVADREAIAGGLAEFLTGEEVDVEIDPDLHVDGNDTEPWYVDNMIVIE